MKNRKFYTYSPWNVYFVLFLVAAFLLVFPLMLLIFAGGVLEAFGPPLITIVATLLLVSTMHPAIAYVSGTIGTPIGADLSNLNKVSLLGAPIASIGGAGTFDGIFVAGILSVLLI